MRTSIRISTKLAASLVAFCPATCPQAMFFGSNSNQITRINAVSGGNTSGSLVASIATPAFLAASGNTVVVFTTQGTSTALTNTVTDTAGNTYTFIAYGTGSGNKSGLFYAKNIVGNAANVVTSTWSASAAYQAISIIQYSGLSGTVPLDQNTSGTATGNNTVTSSAFTTTAANEVIVAGGSVNALGNAFTAGSGYVIRTQDSSPIQAFEDRIVSTVQTGGTAAMSTGTNPNWTMLVGTFKQ